MNKYRLEGKITTEIGDVLSRIQAEHNLSDEMVIDMSIGIQTAVKEALEPLQMVDDDGTIADRLWRSVAMIEENEE
jgi:hypothetical protein